VDINSRLQVTASPNSGYTFEKWLVNGQDAGAGNPGEFAVLADTNVTAAFKRFGGGSGGSSGGGSSGSSRGGFDGRSGGRSAIDDSAVFSVTATPFIVDVPTANSSLQTMRNQGKQYAQIRHNGPIKVLADAFQTFGQTTVNFDSMVGNAVKVRVKVSQPGKIKTDMMLSGSVQGISVDARQTFLQRWYQNKFAIIHLDQAGAWGQAVTIAAKVDISGMDMKNLFFYSYDKASNTITHIKQPNYWMDANGYLHFTTELAGDIVISDSALIKK